MMRESEAILLRIFIGESYRYDGKPLYEYLVEFFRKEGLAGATVLRGISGFGKNSHISKSSILRLSTDLPVVVEVADKKEKIEKIKPKLTEIVRKGLITEESVKIILYEAQDK
jgi:PII-like signaling protein